MKSKLQEVAMDFLSQNDSNVYGKDLGLSIFGNPVEVESIWYSYKEDKIYIHVCCKEFEGDVDINSLSDENQQILEVFLRKHPSSNF